MKTIKQFFKLKTTYLGIAVALIFQVIFFSVWLTAYDGVLERTDQFSIALNNEDIELNERITKQLTEQSPIPITVINDFETAQKELDERKINMIIHIPHDFSQKVQEDNNAKITYYINDSNPSLGKQMMETVAHSMTDQINEQLYEYLQMQLEEAVPASVANEAPNQEEVYQLASEIVKTVQQSSNPHIVQADIVKEHHVEGFQATMIPLMVVLASFIGAMVMSQQLQISEEKLRGIANRWSLFLTRQFINFIVSACLSLITLGIVMLFSVQIDSSLLLAWLFQSLLFFSFLAISQLFVILLGNVGMVFNIVLTATQLVSSGAILPRELLSTFYEKLGAILPATYGVNGYFSLIYGGGNINSDINYLLMITGIALGITIAGVGIIWLVERRVKK